MHQKKKGEITTRNREESKQDVEATKKDGNDQRQANRQSFISGVHDISHVVVRTAKESAAREANPKVSSSTTTSNARVRQNPPPKPPLQQKHRHSYIQPDLKNSQKTTRNSFGCTYQVQPDRLMRQALSISFHDKTPADRAELRATMSMSGVFDFHNFPIQEDGEATATSPADTQGESTKDSGDHT